MRWWRRQSLRTRLMVLGVGGLAAGLALGGAVLVAALAVTLQRSADAEATRTGQDVARLVAEDALPEPLPVAGEQLVQVVDEQNRVLAASIGADRLVPMLRDAELADLRGGGQLSVGGNRLGVDGPVRVVAVPAAVPSAFPGSPPGSSPGAFPAGGPADGGVAAAPEPAVTVLVGKPMSDLRHSVEWVRTLLLVAFPLLVAATAVVTWRVLGATLRPVEQLRAGAADITAAGGPATLPVPASHDEIHRLAVTLNDMLERLETSRARQRVFVADAAHELRSPLANLRTQLEVAQRLGSSTDWDQLATDLLADAQRLSRLVDDLLLLARTDDLHAQHRGVEPVELTGLLRAVTEPYPAVTVVTDQPLWTEGVPEELRRVVANLLDNAVRHAREQVTVAAVYDGDWQLVTVTDDGPGIPPADRERVFERFTRLDDARARDAGGAGLGLAIVRELVRRHGGTVRLAGADPDGTGPGLRAEVRLPAAAAAPPG